MTRFLSIGRRTRILGLLAIAAVVAFIARNAIVQSLVTFHPTHRVRAPHVTLTPDRATQLDQARSPASPRDLVTFALHETAAELRFGLSHPTRLAFDGKNREGNCVEYAELFAAIVRRERGDLDVRAWVVRSDASIFGLTIPNPAWRDHDWVLVIVDGRERMYVDPTLYDMGFGYDISRSVRGDVTIPPQERR